MDEMHGMGDMQPIFKSFRRILLIRCHTCVKTTDNKSQFFERGAVNLFTQLCSYETEYCSETEVYLAAGHRSAGILKEIVHRDPSCLNVDDGCETVLHSAARYGCVESVKFLKENGCDVNASNKQKQTPLHVAAENNQSQIISYLLSVGADLDVEDTDGKTPLHLASIAHSSASVKAIKEHIDQIKSLKQSPKAKKQKRKGKQESKYKRYKKNQPKNP
ncbi:CARD- and ANK-domain containing inflammasome adapter protein-like [Gigantopelta aegis]|uniref:CARD- and ANK-domain containing inflammasome adapter protein-like n=1 Tax=Gigantopelta aegis TaxID=1735272 RepID=UPI001B8897CC|nr:CARD- and ANK-domain containing inflammasome adapter protein-like [Gigantopelta aegis]